MKIMHYDTETYKVVTWKNPTSLFWILFPAQAVNELLIGQRVPKVMLVEKYSFKPLGEKSIVPCPHCNTMHSGMKWSMQNSTSYGNWFGLYCDHCGGIIPCLTNLTTYLILGLTFPLWCWFVGSWRATWLEQQKAKFALPIDLRQPKTRWWEIGLPWGVWMYCCVVLFIPFISGEAITTHKLLTGIPIWLIGGALFGLVMQYHLGGKKVGSRKS